MNTKERTYNLTVTFEVKVIGETEQLAIDHLEQLLSEDPGLIKATEVLEWEVS